MRPDATRQTLAEEGDAALFSLPRELLTTDRILCRWALGAGSGLPSEEWNDRPIAKLTLLPPHVDVTVDQIIAKSPPRTKRIITSWYRTPEPAMSIARALGMSRSSLYRAHGLCVNHMRWKFESSDNADLVLLVKMFDA